MPLISLCMIVRNEEAVLGRCLDSVADLVDEIILVDTGSTDNTKAVAAEYAAKIYDFPWCDDFSAARNYAVSQALQKKLGLPELLSAASLLEVLNTMMTREELLKMLA